MHNYKKEEDSLIELTEECKEENLIELRKSNIYERKSSGSRTNFRRIFFFFDFK